MRYSLGVSLRGCFFPDENETTMGKLVGEVYERHQRGVSSIGDGIVRWLKSTCKIEKNMKIIIKFRKNIISQIILHFNIDIIPCPLM